MSDTQAPSKELGCYVMDRVMYTSHADGSETSRKATDEEVLLADALLRTSDELRFHTREAAHACQQYREVLAENTKLKRAAHEPSALRIAAERVRNHACAYQAPADSLLVKRELIFQLAEALGGSITYRPAQPPPPDEQIDHAIRRIEECELSMDDSEGLVAMLTELKQRRAAQPPGVLQAEVERMRKLFYLAAQEVIFFSTYDKATDSWPSIGRFYAPCVNLGDTFAYASADGEELPDGEIDRLISANEQWGYDGVVAWASLIRKCEPIEPRRTPAYHEARSALTKEAKP